MLELRDVSKTFLRGTPDEFTLFDHFNLSIRPGAFVCVVGSNGSGKTTLLNLVCGSVEVDTGDVYIAGTRVNRMREYKRARRIGRVYQNPAMGTCGSMTLLQNMALADNKGKPFNLRPGTNRRRIDFYREALAQLGLGLEDRLGACAGSLSGGQRQAMALVMATLTPVDVLILDEHTAALDPKTAELIMQLTDKIVRRKQITTLMVTHNLRYAVEYGDRLLMMHEGRAVCDYDGDQKQTVAVENLLGLFNQISIECGN